MTNGEKIVDSLVRWLLEGPLGDKLRGEDYRNLISCGFRPALKDPGDIGTIHTSCGVFVRGILDDARVRRALGPARVGWPFWDALNPKRGWLAGLGFKHPAWVPLKAGAEPKPGSVFYIERPGKPNDNHTGFFVERNEDGSWKTAEGGGGDGTKCQYGKRRIERNQNGRNLLGWYDPDLLDFDRRDTDPMMPAVRDT
jgi:hypothetical protein